MIDCAWLVLRAAGLILTFHAAGAAFFSAVFGRASGPGAPAIRRLAVRVSGAALVVLAAQMVFEPAHLAGELSGLTDDTQWRVFLGSSLALALALRIGAILAVALTLQRLRPAAALAAGLLAVGSFLLTGHTSVHPQRLWLASLLLAHLAIVAFWFGSLWPLRQLLVLEAPAQAAAVIAAFSAIAVWLVPVIALAGAGMAALLLPDVAALWQPYGRLLLGKVALFVLLMGLAGLNRLRLAPALARGDATAAARLRGSIALEYVLLCVTFAVTAVMTGSYSPGAG